MSDVYEGLTSGQYEDWEPEYDVDDLEPEVFLVDENNYSPVSDEDTGYGPNSYFAQSMITE